MNGRAFCYGESSNGRSPGGGPGESDPLERPHTMCGPDRKRSRKRSVAARLWADVVERGKEAEQLNQTKNSLPSVMQGGMDGYSDAYEIWRARPCLARSNGEGCQGPRTRLPLAIPNSLRG